MNKYYIYQKFLLEKNYYLLKSTWELEIWFFYNQDFLHTIKKNETIEWILKKIKEKSLQKQKNNNFLIKKFENNWFHLFHNNFNDEKNINYNKFILDKRFWSQTWYTSFDLYNSHVYHMIFSWSYFNIWKTIFRKTVEWTNIKYKDFPTFVNTNYLIFNWNYVSFQYFRSFYKETIEKISNVKSSFQDWKDVFILDSNWFIKCVKKYHELFTSYHYSKRFIQSNITKIISYLLFLKDIEDFRNLNFDTFKKENLFKFHWKQVEYTSENSNFKINTDTYLIAVTQMKKIYRSIKEMIVYSYYDEYLKILQENWLFEIFSKQEFNELIKEVQKIRIQNFMSWIWITLKNWELNKEYKYSSIIFRFLYLNDIINESDFWKIKRLFIQIFYNLKIDQEINFQ